LNHFQDSLKDAVRSNDSTRAVLAEKETELLRVHSGLIQTMQERDAALSQGIWVYFYSAVFQHSNTRLFVAFEKFPC